MSTNATKKTIVVLDPSGLFLSFCTWKKAFKLLCRGRAVRLNVNTIKLNETPQMRRQRRRNIILRDGDTCYICGQRVIRKGNATIDHVVPKSKSNKADVYGNMKCCCDRCNSDKGNMMPSEYIKHILDNRERYDYISDKRLKDLSLLFKEYEELFTEKEE